MKMSKSIIDAQIESIAEEQGVDIDTAAELYAKESEYTFDISKLREVKHNWVRRGLKVSCEGANHPHHSHFLR